MTHLWVDVGADWALMQIGAERLILTDDPSVPIRCEGTRPNGGCSVVLAPISGSEWVLLARPGNCRVNGEPVDFGIRALKDKDEIQVGNGPRIFFSTENPAQVAPFAGAQREAICPRCMLPIEKGQPAVVCPVCSTAVHEDPLHDLPCWTYGSCPGCRRPGTLEGDYQWSPECL